MRLSLFFTVFRLFSRLFSDRFATIEQDKAATAEHVRVLEEKMAAMEAAHERSAHAVETAERKNASHSETAKPKLSWWKARETASAAGHVADQEIMVGSAERDPEDLEYEALLARSVAEDERTRTVGDDATDETGLYQK